MLGLSAVLFARMLGFSLVLPMFSHHAIDTLGATHAQAGLAFGIYGLSQALLQLPFGTWSDRFGRRTMVAIGLIIFVVGAVVSATSHDILWLTIGYFLQGASAIASAILAWVSDTVDASRRNTGMAILGISIGTAIVLGLPISPILAAHFGGAAVFWLCAALSTVALLVVLCMDEPQRASAVSAVPTRWTSLLQDRELLVLYAAGFLVYFTMRAVFFVVPLSLKTLDVSLPALYAVIGIVGGVMMGMGSRQSDKGRARASILMSLGLTLVGYLLLARAGWSGTVVGYGAWFAGFAVLQALLPAAVSKLASAEARGATLGLFNTCQYIGTALGGVAAGCLGAPALYATLAVVTLAVMAGSTTLRRVDAAPAKSPA